MLDLSNKLRQSMVIQIARNIVGARKIIGIAGTDEKCRWVESLGADYCKLVLSYESDLSRVKRC